MGTSQAQGSGLGTNDHGALLGLPDDDHLQYLLLANRAGGQLIGSQGAGRILSIEDSGNTERIRIEEGGPHLLDLISTTQGLGLPDMTEVQRDAIGPAAGDAGLLVFNTTTGQTNQWDGSAWTVPGAGLTTLQGAYDNDPTGAQILLDATPNPFSVQAQVAGTVIEWLDVGGNPIMRVSADPDTVQMDAGVTIDDAFTNSGAANSLTLSDTFTTGGAYVGGGILSNGTVTYNSSVFIWALLQESKTYAAAAGPGFAAFTLFNALARIQNSGNFDLVQALTLNVGVTHVRTTSGTSVTSSNIGMNFAPGIQTLVSGAVMTRTNCTAIGVNPTWSTVAGSTVNMGTIRGILFAQPAQALFGSSAGVENMTAYYGIDFPNMTFGGASAVYSVIRSQLNSGTNKRFLDHTGSASSRMRGHLIFDVDAFGVILGASSDVLLRWQAAGYFSIFFNNTSDDLQISTPAADRYLFNGAGGNTVTEFNFNCLNASFGAQTGAVGNQHFAFVAGAKSVSVAGEYAQVLLTQAGNLTLNAAMSRVVGWTINAPSITLGTGSVTDAATLLVGGNVNQGTNRYGLHIISNPSGGGGVNHSLRVAGSALFDDEVEIDGDLNHDGTNVGFYGVAPVAQSAAYTPTNVTTDRSYDANSTTLDELADVVGTMIADLQAVGLLG